MPLAFTQEDFLVSLMWSVLPWKCLNASADFRLWQRSKIFYFNFIYQNWMEPLIKLNPNIFRSNLTKIVNQYFSSFLSSTTELASLPVIINFHGLVTTFCWACVLLLYLDVRIKSIGIPVDQIWLVLWTHSHFDLFPESNSHWMTDYFTRYFLESLCQLILITKWIQLDRFYCHYSWFSKE